MLQQFSKDIRLHKNNLFAFLGILAGSFLLGMIMVVIIMATDDDPGAWFCMGTLMASLVLVAAGLFMSALNYSQQFMLALSMGRTRKSFMVSYYLQLLLELVSGWLLILLLHQIELKTYSLAYYMYQNEIYFSFLTDWRVVLPVFLLMPLISMFMGALHGKYGKKGLTVFYFLWLFCCFILPRMFHEEPSEGVLDQMAVGLLYAVRVVPVPVWIAFGAITLIGMAITTVKFGMEQMVK